VLAYSGAWASVMPERALQVDKGSAGVIRQRTGRTTQYKGGNGPRLGEVVTECDHEHLLTFKPLDKRNIPNGRRNYSRYSCC